MVLNIISNFMFYFMFIKCNFFNDICLSNYQRFSKYIPSKCKNNDASKSKENIVLRWYTSHFCKYPTFCKILYYLYFLQVNNGYLQPLHLSFTNPKPNYPCFALESPRCHARPLLPQSVAMTCIGVNPVYNFGNSASHVTRHEQLSLDCQADKTSCYCRDDWKKLLILKLQLNTYIFKLFMLLFYIFLFNIY